MIKEGIRVCNAELAESFSRRKKLFKEYFFMYFCMYLGFILLLATVLLMINLNVIIETVEDFESLNAGVVYAQIVSLSLVYIWFVLIIAVPLWVVFSSICINLLVIFDWIVGICYCLTFSIDQKLGLKSIRYEKIINIRAARQLEVLFWVFMVALAFYAYLNMRIQFTIEELITLCFRSILIVIPIIFTVPWLYYLNVRKTRKTKKKKQNFDHYFLSKQIIQKKLKHILSLLLFLAIFGNILLPSMLFASGSFINIGPSTTAQYGLKKFSCLCR